MNCMTNPEFQDELSSYETVAGDPPPPLEVGGGGEEISGGGGEEIGGGGGEEIGGGGGREEIGSGGGGGEDTGNGGGDDMSTPDPQVPKRHSPVEMLYIETRLYEPVLNISNPKLS